MKGMDGKKVAAGTAGAAGVAAVAGGGLVGGDMARVPKQKNEEGKPVPRYGP